MNSGELCVVSDFVKKAFSVASALECQCHLMSSAARLSYCLEKQELSIGQSPALDISPRQAVSLYMGKKENKK